jgi:hypothetical protein
VPAGGARRLGYDGGVFVRRDAPEERHIKSHGRGLALLAARASLLARALSRHLVNLGLLTRRMAHCVLCSAPGPHRSSGSVRPFASQFQTGADGYPNLFSHSR